MPLLSCPYRTPSLPTVAAASANTTDSSPPPAPDTSQWKFPWCDLPRVSVWHGSARHSHPAMTQSVTPPPPVVPAFMLVSVLRDAVDSLKSQCASLASSFDAIEAHFHAIEAHFNTLTASFDDLSTKLPTNYNTLKSIVEAQQVDIKSVSTITEKLNSLAACLEKVFIPPLDSSSRGLQQKLDVKPCPAPGGISRATQGRDS
ncbi:hypothetical protein SK128_017977 [Halocaridina rubra]|uniref:Uncharacterized protein n=1 Tax=Halocaridina rubra TaxID=373956 RepID=A0AAN8WQ95_HALRR